MASEAQRVRRVHSYTSGVVVLCLVVEPKLERSA